MSHIEYTTVAHDWTSGALLDMTTANDSSGSPSPVNHTYKPDTDMVVLVTTTSVIGLVFNIAALAVLLKKRDRQTTTNLYLVMLAVGELVSL
ncbi:hypothetical protein NP493_127g04022 [Ridgeia piscesae]|uniref:G-protein coupled receptors family 1 profile domain-containing protein n=1 Tax=Ridgeia piscesae TaxID=27915 RepID=A0AAD9P5W0_RIDPI|nr:hypothetical protein NP493_127g04022 [Ridgeia piscesae]